MVKVPLFLDKKYFFLRVYKLFSVSGDNLQL